MNILQLFVQLGIKGADKVEAALGGVEQQAEHAAGGIKHSGEAAHEAEAKFEHFEFAALEAVFALQQFVSVGKETIEVITEFSGLEAASEWNHLSRSIQNVTGSAEDARNMLKELKEVGAQTGFNSQDLAKIAPQLVNSGVRPEDVPGQLKSMANLAAMGNLSRDQLPELLETMVHLRNMDHPAIRQLESLNALPIKDLVNAGAGTHFKTANQAYDFLASTGLGQANKILLAGADALGKDAAALQKANDPAMALAKTLETLEEVMEPTGELLLKILGPVGVAFGWLAEQMEHLNAITGGSAGLIAIILLLVRHHKLLISSFRAAIRYTQELAEAVERYGAAAEAASVVTGGIHGGGEAVREAEGAAHGAEEVGLAARMSASVKGMLASVKAFAKNPVSMVKDIKIGEVLKVAKLAKIADIATFATGLGLETLGDHLRGADGRQSRGGAITQGVGEGIGFGGLGFFLGPWVGLATTLVGAIAGGVIGNNRFNHQPKADENIKALQDNTAALTELKGTAVGGGARTRAAFSQMQLERSVAKAMAGMA